jgi:hypothetical protein
MTVKRRRITKADIKFVSLCAQGKNGMSVIYKSDGTVEIQTLTKMNDKGELTAVVWPPNREDSEGDFIDNMDVIKDMAHSHARNGFKLDIHHDGKALSPEDVYVAENFIIQKGDARFQDWKDYQGKTIPDLAGGWAQIYRIENKNIRKAFRKGLWNGVSLFGPATVEIVDKSATQTIKTMDEQELAKAIRNAFKPEPQVPTVADISKGVVDALIAAGVVAKKAEDEPKAPAPAKRADRASRGPRLTDYSPEGIERYQLEKSAHTLLVAIEKASEADDPDVEEIQEMCADLETISKAMKDSGLFGDDDDADDAEPNTSARRLARKARRGLSKGKPRKRQDLIALLKGADPAGVEALQSEEDLDAFVAAGDVLKFMNPSDTKEA